MCRRRASVRFGDELRALYVVRSGGFRLYRTDNWGTERVLGFALPGELAGVDGIYPQRHVSNAVALQDSAVCALPYRELATRMERSESLRRQIFRLVSRETGAATLFTRDSIGEERMARFLLDLSRRQELQGRSAVEIDLPMPWSDVANYLHMTAADTARVFESFCAQQLIVSRRGGRCHLRELERLRRLTGRR